MLLLNKSFFLFKLKFFNFVLYTMFISILFFCLKNNIPLYAQNIQNRLELADIKVEYSQNQFPPTESMVRGEPLHRKFNLKNNSNQNIRLTTLEFRLESIDPSIDYTDFFLEVTTNKTYFTKTKLFLDTKFDSNGIVFLPLLKYKIKAKRGEVFTVKLFTKKKSKKNHHQIQLFLTKSYTEEFDDISNQIKWRKTFLDSYTELSPQNSLLLLNIPRIESPVLIINGTNFSNSQIIINPRDHLEYIIFRFNLFSNITFTLDGFFLKNDTGYFNYDFLQTIPFTLWQDNHLVTEAKMVHGKLHFAFPKIIKLLAGSSTEFTIKSKIISMENKSDKVFSLALDQDRGTHGLAINYLGDLDIINYQKKGPIFKILRDLIPDISTKQLLTQRLKQNKILKNHIGKKLKKEYNSVFLDTKNNRPDFQIKKVELRKNFDGYPFVVIAQLCNTGNQDYQVNSQSKLRIDVFANGSRAKFFYENTMFLANSCQSKLIKILPQSLRIKNPGQYFFEFLVDANNSVSESKENNNLVTTKISLICNKEKQETTCLNSQIKKSGYAFLDSDYFINLNLSPHGETFKKEQIFFKLENLLELNK